MGMSLWSLLCRKVAGITPEVEQAIAVRREAIAAREARKANVVSIPAARREMARKRAARRFQEQAQ